LSSDARDLWKSTAQSSDQRQQADLPLTIRQQSDNWKEPPPRSSFWKGAHCLQYIASFSSCVGITMVFTLLLIVMRIQLLLALESSVHTFQPVDLVRVWFGKNQRK
jgi:hypothetical protein